MTGTETIAAPLGEGDPKAMWADIDKLEREGRPLDGSDPALAEPVVAKTIEEKPEPAAPAADAEKKPDPAPAPAADLWANATPEQKAAFEAAETRRNALEHENRSNRGRISGLTRALEVARKPAPAPAAAKEGEEKPPSKTETLRTDYPEVAEGVAALVEETVAPLKRELEVQREQTNAETLDAQDALVRSDHPDYDDIKRDPIFGKWIERQPQHVLAAIERNGDTIVDGQEVSDVLQRFKDDRTLGRIASTAAPAAAPKPAAPSGKRAVQLASTTAVRSDGPLKAGDTVSSDDPKEIWNQFDAMDRKRAASR